MVADSEHAAPAAPLCGPWGVLVAACTLSESVRARARVVARSAPRACVAAAALLPPARASAVGWHF
jgi:hypothetical protein